MRQDEGGAAVAAEGWRAYGQGEHRALIVCRPEGVQALCSCGEADPLHGGFTASQRTRAWKAASADAAAHLHGQPAAGSRVGRLGP